MTKALLRDPVQTRYVQISLPGDPSAQTANARLTFGLDQQTQPLFDHCTLRTGAAAPHSLPHQAIVDIDVRPHLGPLCVRISDSCVSVNSRQYGTDVWWLRAMRHR